MEALKLKIHETLQNLLGDYIPVQELTHASNEICKSIKEDGTYDEDVLLAMHSYLQQPDKEFTVLQTVNTKSLTNNQIIIAMNEIRKTLKEYKNSLPTEEPEENVVE